MPVRISLTQSVASRPPRSFLCCMESVRHESRLQKSRHFLMLSTIGKNSWFVYPGHPPQTTFDHSRSQQPGAHPPVDLIPIMKYIPERWASWKTEVKITRSLQRKLYFGLLEQVEARLQKGSSSGCFMETVIEKGPGFGLDREAVGYDSTKRVNCTYAQYIQLYRR